MKRIPLIALAAAGALAACGPKHPGKAAAGPLPPLPAWAADYIGKPLDQVFARSDACAGNTETVLRRFSGPPAGTEVAGWAWDVGAKRRVEHVILVDMDRKIVGAGEGGRFRKDVPKNRPDVPDLQTGWRALTTQSTDLVAAFAVVDDGRAVCPLGKVGL